MASDIDNNNHNDDEDDNNNHQLQHEVLFMPCEQWG